MRTNPRRRARELVLQGLYQQQLSGNSADAVHAQLVEAPGYPKADAEYFEALWRGVSGDAAGLAESIVPHLDRPLRELSPIERAILTIAAWELRERLEIPYRVVINEAVELAKSYGGTDGYKFVNGVADQMAAVQRAAEIRAIAAESAPGLVR